MSRPYTARELAGLAAWELRRGWSKTETVRWMDDHRDSCAEWLQRRQRIALPHAVRKPGMWVKLRFPKTFDLLHGRLEAITPALREQIDAAEIFT